MKTAATNRTAKTVIYASLATAIMTLSSCGSMYPSSDRADGRRFGSPQTAGWTTSKGVREAEQKSIARDMPFAAVSAQGNIVQR